MVAAEVARLAPKLPRQQREVRPEPALMLAAALALRLPAMRTGAIVRLQGTRQARQCSWMQQASLPMSRVVCGRCSTSPSMSGLPRPGQLLTSDVECLARANM